MQTPDFTHPLAGYRRRANELLTADEQDAVIDLIAYEPTCGDLISGTVRRAIGKSNSAA